MEYRIVLQRMEFRALHGCYELERKVGNRFTVDLEITACLGDAAAEDSVEQTVNYLTVYEVVSLQMRITQRTIERVAMNIIEAVYASFRQVRHGMIRVRFLILFSMSRVSKVFLTVVEENLPAAQAVRTDMPDASVMIRFTGSLERSSSPETRK